MSMLVAGEGLVVVEQIVAPASGWCAIVIGTVVAGYRRECTRELMREQLGTLKKFKGKIVSHSGISSRLLWSSGTNPTVRRNPWFWLPLSQCYMHFSKQRNEIFCLGWHLLCLFKISDLYKSGIKVRDINKALFVGINFSDVLCTRDNLSFTAL